MMACLPIYFFRRPAKIDSGISIEKKTENVIAESNLQRLSVDRPCQDMRTPPVSENLADKKEGNSLIEARFVKAIENDDIAGLRAILEKHEVSDLDGLDDNMYSPVHLAVRYSTGALEVLIDYGFDINAPSKDGLSITPLHFAATSCNAAAIKLLVETGKAELNTLDSDGLTPLHVTCLKNFNKGAELLLKQGADPCVDLPTGSSILTASVTANNQDMARILVKYGSDVNHNQHQITPLVAACIKENVDLVIFLLENGADPSAPDKSRAPLLIARACNNQAIIDLLNSYKYAESS